MYTFALTFALLLPQASAPAAAAAATPVPTARPAPALGRAGEPARPRSLSEHAALMKANGTPTKPVSFDDVKTVDPADAAAASSPPAGGRSGAPDARKKGGKGGAEDADAVKAQRRMDKAVARGLAVPERGRGSSRDKARREWDDAAEACRTTPGCNPKYRDDALYGENKPLKTDEELIDDIRKRGFSEPHPLPK
jgi:hypothetical protein